MAFYELAFCDYRMFKVCVFFPVILIIVTVISVMTWLRTKGGNLATWRYGVSFCLGVLKPRCQVSVLVWFYGCWKIGFGFSFAYAQLRLLGFSFGSSFIQKSYFILNTNDSSALLLGDCDDK